MITALNNFNKNLVQVKQYCALYNLIVSNLPTLASQAESLLRAEWVMVVSNFDTYIHDIVRIALIQIFRGTRASNNGADAYTLSFNTLKRIDSLTNTSDKEEALEIEIRKINEKYSYQSPKSIEYAMSLIGISGIWTKISPSLGMSSQDIKLKLGLIVNRRNKIAHESDYDYLSSAQIAITKDDVDEVVLFIERLVNAIHLQL